MTEAEREIFSLPQVEAEPQQSKRALVAKIELEQKLAAARERLAEIDAERERRAFDGMLERGGTPNRRSLEKLRADGASVSEEIKDYERAISVSEARLLSSRAAAAQSQVVQDARRVQDDLCRALRDEAAACGNALTSFRMHLERFLAASSELHRLGYGPVPRLTELQVERALATSLAGLRLSPPSVLAPANRIEMPAIAEGICQNAEAAALRVINNGAAA